MEVIIVIIIIAALFTSAKKKFAELTDGVNDEDPEKKRALEEALRRRMQQESAQEVRGELKPRVHSSYEGGSTMQPTYEGRYAHTAQEDSGSPCDAHTLPQSSEGSPIRAHSRESDEGKACAEHTAPVSTEGESLQDRLTRFKTLKSEHDAHEKLNHRYDKPEDTSVQVQSSNVNLKFDKEAVLQGIIYSEILGKPKALSKN